MAALLKLWIWLCVYLNVAGWTLSALHQLNAVGYAIALVLFAAVAWIFRAQLCLSHEMFKTFAAARRRFARPLPLIFLAALVMSLLGGALYAPCNYDALTYRLPRILNWLAAGHWFWIPGINDRMNYSGVGAEWLAAPQFALLRTDRTLFLANIISFAFMPGLLFSVFRQLGVRRRTTWTWMWLLPLAGGYVMQAGSVGNDLTGAVFCLASVHFGLRARKSGLVSDVWLALMTAALMTGVKMSNLPLALPCLIAVWPALPMLLRAPTKSFAVLALAALASALPMMALNQAYCGKWSGDPQNLSQIQVNSPVAALFGNTLQLAQSSLLPPVLPGALKIFERMNAALPASWHDYLHREFPRYYLGNFQELPSEEGAGLGLGITASLLFLGVLALFQRPRISWTSPSVHIALAAFVAFMAYMTKMGSEATVRLLLPYYPLLAIPFLKLPIQEVLLRRRAWNIWLLLVALSIFPALILSPLRPLFPSQPISAAWLKKNPDSQFARRFAATYATYAHRNDLLRAVRENIPSDVRVVGLAAGSNDPEYSLWRPFGVRTVRCVWNGSKPQELVVPTGIEWLVVHGKYWDYHSSVPLAEWAARHRAQIVATVPVVIFAKFPADDWYVLQLEKPADAGVITPKN